MLRDGFAAGNARGSLAVDNLEMCIRDRVMGLGGQLTLWPDEFVDALNARGFRTIRYDNRDVGLSTRFDAAGVPNLCLLYTSRCV